MARSILLEGSRLKKNFYDVKSMMKPFGIGYQKINIFPNFYMYYLENIDLIECKMCWHIWYKPRTSRSRTFIAYRKLRYFPITPKLQRLFMSLKITGHMARRHSHYVRDIVMVHHSDGKVGSSLIQRILNLISIHLSHFLVS